MRNKPPAFTSQLVEDYSHGDDYDEAVRERIPRREKVNQESIYPKANSPKTALRTASKDVTRLDDPIILPIYRSGDVLLIVGYRKQQCTGLKISSSVMSQASSLLRSCLRDDLGKGTVHGLRYLHLLDDDPEAMRIMCDILHQNGGRVYGPRAY